MQNALHHSSRVLYMKSLSINVKNKIERVHFVLVGCLPIKCEALSFIPSTA